MYFFTGKPIVQQASKQIQVDLQDLGYETCGRSENEADREEVTSPGNVRESSTKAEWVGGWVVPRELMWGWGWGIF